MPSYFHQIEIACGLGDSPRDCCENLKQSQVKTRSVSLESYDVRDLPYFLIEDAPDLNRNRVSDMVDRQIQNIIDQQGLTKAQLARTGLFVGSSSFSVGLSEAMLAEDIENGVETPLFLPLIGYGYHAEKVRQKFGLSDHIYTYATACTSSVNALLYADKFLEQNIIDHAIVVGYEFFNRTTALGFSGLELVSASAKLSPFDSSRDGLVLGEGCTSLLLSREKKQSSVRFLAGACNTDNYSLTAANVDGSTIASVVEKAISNAEISSTSVKAVKAHGTASIMNDEAEAAGLLRVFDSVPPIFALKPYVGHTLGGCGALETALTIMALEDGFIPANPGVAVEIDELGVKLNQANLTAESGHYLLNFFAFGGNNTSVVIEKF